jgi:DNA-binding transcriptional LysR family regulator
MQPTQRALQLASGVREGLEKLELALTRKDPVPAQVPRTFRIGSTDYPCMVVLPSLVKRLAKSTPKVELRVAMLPRRLALSAAAHAPLALLDPPYRSITIEIEMLWVEGAAPDGGVQWLLNELTESIGELG